MVIGYNTNMVSSQEAPKAWADLLDPTWKGNMGIVTNADNWFIPMVKMMGEEKGLEYMKRLSVQNLQWRTGRTLVTQLVAAGEYGIGIAVYNQRVEELKSKGAPLEWVPVDPVFPEIHPLAISSHAAHPNAARLFVDFVLSREGQEMMASFYRIPSRVDVDPMVPKLKRGLRVMPWDPTVVDEYERYYKLYRKVLMRK
jgi:iron(III) transport system substrate-binding protein